MNKPSISQYKTSHDSPGFLLWQVTIAWRRSLERVLVPFGLTHVQYVLMAVLWYLSERAMDNITQVKLANFSSCDVTMTSMVLRSLEKKGWVKRFQKPGDSRSKYPELTVEGFSILKKAMKVVEIADEAFFEPLSSQDRKNWMQLTQQLRSSSNG